MMQAISQIYNLLFCLSSFSSIAYLFFFFSEWRNAYQSHRQVMTQLSPFLFFFQLNDIQHVSILFTLFESGCYRLSE